MGTQNNPWVGLQLTISEQMLVVGHGKNPPAGAYNVSGGLSSPQQGANGPQWPIQFTLQYIASPRAPSVQSAAPQPARGSNASNEAFAAAQHAAEQLHLAVQAMGKQQNQGPPVQATAIQAAHPSASMPPPSAPPSAAAAPRSSMHLIVSGAASASAASHRADTLLLTQQAPASQQPQVRAAGYAAQPAAAPPPAPPTPGASHRAPTPDSTRHREHSSTSSASRPTKQSSVESAHGGLQAQASQGFAALSPAQRPVVRLLLSQFVSGIREHVLYTAKSTRGRVLVLCPAAAWQHQTPPQHVEAPARISLTLQRLQMKLGDRLDYEHNILPVQEELITRVHGQQYWSSLGKLRKAATAAMQSVRSDSMIGLKQHVGKASGASGRGRGRGRPPKNRPPPLYPRSPMQGGGDAADGASQSSLNDASSLQSGMRQRYGVGAAEPMLVHPGLSNGLISVSDREESVAGDSDDSAAGGDPWLASIGKLLERDTYVSPKTVSAVRQSVAAVLQGAKEVLSGTRVAAFALVRPPGHHAGCCSHVGRSQGFCLVNNVMCAVTEVLRSAPQTRVAVVDIDTHFGNGSYAIARALARSLTPSDSADSDDFTYLMRDTDSALAAMERGAVRQSHLEARAARSANADAPAFMLASIHQFNDEAYPANVIANPDEDGRTQATQTICEGGANVTLVTEGVPCGSSNDLWRERFRDRVMVELKRFKADLVFISAGFDAHVDDPVGQLRLVDADFQWAAQQVGAAMPVPRIVSVLEGGYGISQDSNWSLLRGAEAHVRGLTRVAEAATAEPLSDTQVARAAASAAGRVVPDLLQAAWGSIVQEVSQSGLSAAVPAKSALGNALLGKPLQDTAKVDALQQQVRTLQAQVQAARAGEAKLQQSTATNDLLQRSVDTLKHERGVLRERIQLEERRVAQLVSEMQDTTRRLTSLALRQAEPPPDSPAQSASQSAAQYNSAMSLAERVVQSSQPPQPAVSALQLVPHVQPVSTEDAIGGGSGAGAAGAAGAVWHPDARDNRKAVHTVSALLDKQVAYALGSSTPSVAGSPSASQGEDAPSTRSTPQPKARKQARDSAEAKLPAAASSSSSGSSSGTGSSGTGSSSGADSSSGSDSDATDADEDATDVEGSAGKGALSTSTLLAIAQSSVRSPKADGSEDSPKSKSKSKPKKAGAAPAAKGRPPGTSKKQNAKHAAASAPRVGGKKRGRVSLSQPLSQAPPATIDLTQDLQDLSSDSDTDSSSDVLSAAKSRRLAAPRKQMATKSGSHVSSFQVGGDGSSRGSSSGGDGSGSGSGSISSSDDEILPISQLLSKKSA